jgi:hypothetical protein
MVGDQTPRAEAQMPVNTELQISEMLGFRL